MIMCCSVRYQYALTYITTWCTVRYQYAQLILPHRVPVLDILHSLSCHKNYLRVPHRYLKLSPYRSVTCGVWVEATASRRGTSLASRSKLVVSSSISQNSVASNSSAGDRLRRNNSRSLDSKCSKHCKNKPKYCKGKLQIQNEIYVLSHVKTSEICNLVQIGLIQLSHFSTVQDLPYTAQVT